MREFVCLFVHQVCGFVFLQSEIIHRFWHSLLVTKGERQCPFIKLQTVLHLQRSSNGDERPATEENGARSAFIRVQVSDYLKYIHLSVGEYI